MNRAAAFAMGRAMTRCECAGVGFEEIAGRIAGGQLSLEEASRLTGCGRICTACLPDLRSFLRQRDHKEGT